MVLLLRKLYLYFTKYQGSRGGPLFSRGGEVKLFSGGRGGGVQMLISLDTHVHTCYFPGGGVRTPYPYGSAHGQCHLAGKYLSQSRF